jgi:hypothetical protein
VYDRQERDLGDSVSNAPIEERRREVLLGEIEQQNLLPYVEVL